MISVNTFQMKSKIFWIEVSQKNKAILWRTSLQKYAQKNEFYGFCCHISCNVAIYCENRSIIRYRPSGNMYWCLARDTTALVAHSFWPEDIVYVSSHFIKVHKPITSKLLIRNHCISMPAYHSTSCDLKMSNFKIL